jgi:uncharacterized protein
VLARWRGATTHREAQANDPVVYEKAAPPPAAPRPLDKPMPRTSDSPLLQPSMGLDPDRFSLLKKPLR